MGNPYCPNSICNAMRMYQRGNGYIWWKAGWAERRHWLWRWWELCARSPSHIEDINVSSSTNNTEQNWMKTVRVLMLQALEAVLPVLEAENVVQVKVEALQNPTGCSSCGWGNCRCTYMLAKAIKVWSWFNLVILTCVNAIYVDVGWDREHDEAEALSGMQEHQGLVRSGVLWHQELAWIQARGGRG